MKVETENRKDEKKRQKIKKGENMRKKAEKKIRKQYNCLVSNIYLHFQKISTPQKLASLS